MLNNSIAFSSVNFKLECCELQHIKKTVKSTIIEYIMKVIVLDTLLTFETIRKYC